MNEAKLNEFMGKLVTDMGGAALMASVLVGEELGLYRALADGALTTPEALAGKAGCNPRLIREWLHTQAAAGYLESSDGKFRLPEEQAMALADEDSPVYVAGGASVLASLFLMWGREAWHLTQLLMEPVYFVSGLNFPVGRLGVLGSVAISLLPLAVGLDAMRQLAFAGTDYPTGTPPPGVEALILVAMVVVFIGVARWSLVALERRAREEGRLSVRWQ